jgi:hypothetical protein
MTPCCQKAVAMKLRAVQAHIQRSGIRSCGSVAISYPLRMLQSASCIIVHHVPVHTTQLERHHLLVYAGLLQCLLWAADFVFTSRRPQLAGSSQHSAEDEDDQPKRQGDRAGEPAAQPATPRQSIGAATRRPGAVGGAAAVRATSWDGQGIMMLTVAHSVICLLHNGHLTCCSSCAASFEMCSGSAHMAGPSEACSRRCEVPRTILASNPGVRTNTFRRDCGSLSIS